MFLRLQPCTNQECAGARKSYRDWGEVRESGSGNRKVMKLFMRPHLAWLSVSWHLPCFVLHNGRAAARHTSFISHFTSTSSVLHNPAAFFLSNDSDETPNLLNASVINTFTLSSFLPTLYTTSPTLTHHLSSFPPYHPYKHSFLCPSTLALIHEERKTFITLDTMDVTSSLEEGRKDVRVE